MMNHTALIQRLFGKPSLAEVSQEQVEALLSQYPYFAPLHWLGAIKNSESTADQPTIQKAAAYAYHPFRLRSYFLQADLEGIAYQEQKSATDPQEPRSGDRADDNSERPEERDPPPGDASGPGDEPAKTLIQPLFTQDYFAYTGTQIPKHMDMDKPPTLEQLHSFTDWLRTLRRPKGALDPDMVDDQASLAAQAENEDTHLKKTAEDSLRPAEEVLTEAMAEVRLSMGQREKALEIYEKLSLSNPEKSSYFAQKIQDLKNR